MSDPENTFRALRGDALFIDRWQCYIGWHRWTKWNDPQKKPHESYYRQHRFCVDCNKASVRKVNIPI
jgi:hypothetical protein